METHFINKTLNKMNTTIQVSKARSVNVYLKKILLMCGILSSLFYVAINIFVVMQYEGYNSASQTVSELSAIDAPTRSLWVSLVIVYSFFVVAFGFGILASAGKNRYLHIAAGLIITYIIVGLFWPPMHQREVIATGGKSLTDTMHIIFTMVTVTLMLLVIGFGAAALGKRFRIYSIVTMALLILFGAITGIDSPDMEAGLPTPWIGISERISIGAYMLWLLVFSFALLQKEKLLRINNGND
jgi:hypothetical protein